MRRRSNHGIDVQNGTLISTAGQPLPSTGGEAIVTIFHQDGEERRYARVFSNTLLTLGPRVTWWRQAWRRLRALLRFILRR